MLKGDGSSLFFYAHAVGNTDDKQIREVRLSPSVGRAHSERQPRRFPCRRSVCYCFHCRY